jgi:DNA-binding GntR family transcriptional regulator
MTSQRLPVIGNILLCVTPTLLAPALQRANLREQVLATIREAFITGQIVPGVVYSAASLAGELGISSSPVREAMLALVEDGLMEVVPNRGYRPVALNRSDLAEIAQLRVLLEVPAAGMAARTDLGARAAELQGLVDQIERTAAQGDVSGNLAADRQFHLTLVDVCGNRRLVQQVAKLRDQTRLANILQLARSGALVGSAAEHRPILAAVLAHDRRRAETLMRAHLGHIMSDWSGDGEVVDDHRRRGDQ